MYLFFYYRYRERHEAQFFGRGHKAGIDIKVSIFQLNIIL